MKSIRLLLDGKCIETSTRNRLKDLTNSLLRDNNDPSLAEELLFLQEFIEKSDFKKIRTENPSLDGRERIFIEIKKNGEDFAIYLHKDLN